MLLLNKLLLRFGAVARMSPEERFWTGVIVAFMFGGSFAYLIYIKIKTRGSADWDEGIIPNHYKPTEENLFELFIAASAAIVRRDLDNHYMKFAYIDRYLMKQFPTVYYRAIDSYQYSLNHVVKIDSLASWSNKHLSKEWKLKLINFLAGVAVCDDGINNDEQRHLLSLMSKMNLDITDFEPLYREKLTRENERNYHHQINYSHLDFFYKVLGLDKTASLEEVKVTYRRLVKLTHPDRFMHESPEIQKQMSEKFREIQTAYESIVNS